MKNGIYDEFTGDWDYSLLPDNILVGRECWFERKDSFGAFRSQLQPGLVLGDRVKVFTWTSFNVEPTGYVEVGNDSMLVGSVFLCSERIVVGKRVVISYNVSIADSDFHPIDPDQRKRDAIAISALAGLEAGNRLLVCGMIADQLVIMDVDAAKKLATVQFPAGSFPFEVVVAPDKKRAKVSLWGH